jgi:hypothetical protein
MLVVRNVFRCKPGKASDLADRFRRMIPLMQAQGAPQARVMVDAVAGFWTVVFELQVADLAAYEKSLNDRNDSAEMRELMTGYMDLIEGGHREIFRLL